MLSSKEKENIEANCIMILQELGKKKKSQLDREIDVFWSRTYEEGNDINSGPHQLNWQIIMQNESTFKRAEPTLGFCLMNHQARNDLRRTCGPAPFPHLWRSALGFLRTLEPTSPSS